MIQRTRSGLYAGAPQRSTGLSSRVGALASDEALTTSAQRRTHEHAYPRPRHAHSADGGLAVLREPEGLRLVIVTFDRQGRMIGYSLHPEREILLDERDPAEVAMVIAALFDGAGHDQ